MATEDKLMGESGGKKVYAAYRIDYGSETDIRHTADGEDRFTGSAKSPAVTSDEHPIKQGYSRKIIVPDASTRDEVTSHLDAQGISYTVEDVAPTSSEKTAIEDWGAATGPEVAEALKWDTAVSDLSSGLITQAEYERGDNSNRGTKFDHPKPRKS